jgi:hypothetical protein
MNDNLSANQNKQPRDHWQEERDRLIAELEKKILGRREQITIQEISTVRLPELVVAAFRNHSRSLVKRERPLVLQGSHRFLLDDKEIKTHLRQLRELLVDRLVLPRDEVIEVIVFAVRLQFDVITKPRTALVGLLYEKAAERDRDDIATVIAGLGEHRPMISGLLNLIGGYPPGPVNREAFVALCRRAEKIAYGEKPVSALMADLRDFANFCSGIDGKPLTEIDNQTVLGILYERNLKELAEGLLPTVTQKDKWPLAEIEKVLEHQIVSSGLTLEGETPGQIFLPPEIDLGAFLQDAGKELGEQAGVRDGTRGQAVALATDGKEPGRSPSGTGVFERVYSMFSDNKEGDATPALPADQDSLAAEHQTTLDFYPIPYQPLYRLIDDKTRTMFVKKIFKRDTAAYQRFIDSLEFADTWKAAKEILDKELSRRSINVFSKEAVRLSDLVFSRYFPRR